MIVAEDLARMLDRINVFLVRQRIGHRQPPPGSIRGTDLEGAAGLSPAGDDGVSWSPSPRGEAHRNPRGAGATVWSSETDDWLATRLPSTGTGRAPAAVVVIHGWLATRLQLAGYRWLAGPVRERADLWLPRLPGHAERTPEGAFSGQACVSADLAGTRTAIATAVAETRRLATWLQDGGQRVLLWGVSLGAWVASLAAARPGVCDGLTLWTPVLDPASTLWRSPLTTDIAGRLEEAGIGEERVRRALAGFDPMEHPPAQSGDRILLVAGEYDNVVRVETVREAASRWGTEPEILPHGHISLMLSPTARRRTHRWLLERAAS